MNDHQYAGETESAMGNPPDDATTLYCHNGTEWVDTNIPLPGRPIPDAMNEVREAAARISSLLSRFEREGEVKIEVDIAGQKGLLTLRIPLPK